VWRECLRLSADVADVERTGANVIESFAAGKDQLHGQIARLDNIFADAHGIDIGRVSENDSVIWEGANAELV
jgi:hypothetical protein